MGKKNIKLYRPYSIMFFIYALFLAVALVIDTPQNIIKGLKQIVLSASVLNTDYIAVGGLAAALVNVILVGIIIIIILIWAKLKPNGATIMAMWLIAGFSFFGHNPFNMTPLIIGGWLYTKWQKDSFLKHSLAVILSITLSPMVSVICFMGIGGKEVSFIIGILVGLLIGFIFPMVSTFCMRVHVGYTLYNMGFAGGLIATFVYAILNYYTGKELETLQIWSVEHKVILACLLYTVSLFYIIVGIVGMKDKKVWKGLKEIMRHAGRAPTDFYIMFGDITYVNMGILCSFATTVVILLKGDLNGPTLSAILTIVGFASFGKHLKNVVPVMLGAILTIFMSPNGFAKPSYMLLILFSSGLAPIAGRFGWIWGMIAGFLHVMLGLNIGFLNKGFNLYNNGYIAGFVALLLVPIITGLRKE